MTSKKYDQHTAVSALLRGETIPDDWMVKLAKVERLYLGGNQIVDPSAIAALTGLEMLDLSDNRIVDPSFLAALTGLEMLYLGSNQIVDPSSLAALREALPGTKIIA